MWWLLLAIGCHGTKDVDVEPSPVPVEPAPAPEPAVEPAVDAPHPVDGDSYAVRGEPTLKGDTITLTVTHGGGCEEHTFALQPGPRTGGTLPLKLVHDAHGDRCRAMLTTELSLSIAPFTAEGDCTESIALSAFPASESTTQWVLALDPAVGCD